MLRGPTAPGRFLRVVEVFPPALPLKGLKSRKADLKLKLEDFVEGVEGIEDLADIILVADLKDTGLAKFSSVAAACLLRSKLGVNAAPVIVARDSNRQSVSSLVMTGLSMGLSSVMLAWGDPYVAVQGVKNVFDYRSLSELIWDTRSLADRYGVDLTILAPIDLSKGPQNLARLATSRLKSGADYLLAQPPTTDAGSTFDSHSAAIEDAGLRSKVLPNVFPFRDFADLMACGAKFRWVFPPSLNELAQEGGEALLREAKTVVTRAKRDGMPGVYLSTRGDPEVARTLLG